MRNSSQHLAIYGGIGMARGRCSRCGRVALIVDDEYLCCNQPLREELQIDDIRRMSSPERRRKIPRRKEQLAILGHQDYRCLYCGSTFGSWTAKDGKPTKVTLVWDHNVPWVYSQNNSKENFVAACSICNGIKSDRMFSSSEEAIRYVRNKRKRKGYAETCGVPG
jgi:5-methylcytosine-specific restriction endonuclease McrA